MTFSKEKYFYRDRGDLVLREVGDLTGLRVYDYCMDIRPDKYGHIQWSVNICVAPPSVPRCCPLGQALKGGVCKDASIPAHFTPPLSADLYGKPINWPVIKNHYNPLNCTENPLLSIPLVPKKSYLLSIPIGIMHIWHPDDGHVHREYTYAPNHCVDGHMDSEGEVVYFANICYTLPEVLHSRVCDGHTCVRKCCKDNEEMSLALFRCIPSNLTAYTPPFTSSPFEYKVVNGKPLCMYQTVVDNATIDSRGNFHYDNEVLSARDYCVEKFSDGRGNIEDKALVCIKDPEKGWAKAREIAFPICQIISVIFLMLTAGCYCLVPELLKGGGWYQLFHVLSLMLAYATMFAQKMFSSTWNRNTCFMMGELNVVFMFV